jgi:large conductance mechanosensitive channel
MTKLIYCQSSILKSDKMGFLKEFMDFMKTQNIFSVALAFIVGIATATLVQALVKDIITPLYSPYLDFLNPATATTLGKSQFLVGDFIMNVVNWLVILLVVFIMGKKLMKS